MDKPLSQERLSEEILGMIEYDLEEGHQISWGHAHLMFTEVKRLQAIEDRYKKIIEFMSSGGRPAMARAMAKHTLKGDVNHE